MKPGSRADVALSFVVASVGVVAIAWGLREIYPPLCPIFAGAVALRCAVGPITLIRREARKAP